MSERKVKVGSMVKHAVVISVPDMRFSRTFNRENQTSLIDFDVMVEGLQRHGFRKIFEDGTLKVLDQKDRIDLELESPEEEDDAMNVTLALDTKDIIELLKSHDTEKIKDTLDKCSAATISRFIQIAITSKIYDGNTVKLLEDAAKKAGEPTKITKLLELAEAAEAPVGELKEVE